MASSSESSSLTNAFTTSHAVLQSCRLFSRPHPAYSASVVHPLDVLLPSLPLSPHPTARHELFAPSLLQVDNAAAWLPLLANAVHAPHRPRISRLLARSSSLGVASRPAFSLFSRFGGASRTYTTLTAMLNTIDLSSYLSGASTPEQDRAVAQAFVNAASQVGFAYVTGWESVVPAELVQEVFEYVSRAAFLSPRDDSRLAVDMANGREADPSVVLSCHAERALLQPAAGEEGRAGVCVEQGESRVPFLRP